MNTPHEIRILLVDDHQMLRQGLRHLLSSQSDLTVVGEAFNRQSAMEQVRILKPHVVLMDIHLPGENGIEVTRLILNEFPDTKVIALSSDSDLELVLEALRAGVSGYVVKDNNADDLIRAIRAVMDRRLYLSPEVSSVVVTELILPAGARTPAESRPVLTERERLLLQLVAEGKRNKEIAEVLSVACKSVETYRLRLMKKLGCTSTAELVRYAIREGFIRA